MAKEVNGFNFEQRHGKERARVWKDKDGRHFMVEWSVSISLLSDCVPAYVQDDNSDIVATDTMKNTVYAKAKECSELLSVEDFAIVLAKHFTSFYSQVTTTIVKIVEKPWERVHADGQPHKHGFKLGSEKHTTEAIVKKSGALQLTSGIEGLSVLKTTKSGFEGFIRDKYTALPETRERMLATEVTALWRYSYDSVHRIPQKPLYFTEKYLGVKKVLMDTFFGPPKEGVYSPSVQRTLYQMGKATLDRFPDISSIQLNMPNLHFLPVNLSTRDNQIVKIRLNKNYRSTRYIVEAASSLIRNNTKRCQLKNALTDNSSGSKITVMECHNEDAQYASVVDKILEFSSADCSYGNIAILYRRQISGKAFQMAFRERKIPFNTHGVAFYRKKVVKTIIAMLRTALPGCDDGPYLRVFKALLPFEKEQKKRVIEHVNKISTIRKCSFLSAACEIFNAKISGTFKRSQLVHARKESSISAVISPVANMIPEKYLLEQRAVVDVDGGTYLNEDCDVRSVLQYLLDDVSEFLSTKLVEVKRDEEVMLEKGCINVLGKFIDYLSQREKENFCARRKDNKNSVTLTTIHQAKGLEWDVVFIIKAYESEIPLLHDYNGHVKETGALVEEERRLFYVAMTRARQKLFILYVTMDSNWQILQPSRFVKEIPHHLLEVQDEISKQELLVKREVLPKETVQSNDLLVDKQSSEADVMPMPGCLLNNDDSEVSMELAEVEWANNGSNFLRRFNVEDRYLISQLFHQWAKKKAFHEPKRLLGKVGFIIDERLRDKRNKNKDLLRSLKFCLNCDEAFHYAQYVLRWEQIPADKRALLMREKQEHFMKARIDSPMGSATATHKQISYLKKLGCTMTPTSRLYASHLIEQYKSLNYLKSLFICKYAHKHKRFHRIRSYQRYSSPPYQDESFFNLENYTKGVLP